MLPVQAVILYESQHLVVVRVSMETVSKKRFFYVLLPLPPLHVALLNTVHCTEFQSLEKTNSTLTGC